MTDYEGCCALDDGHDGPCEWVCSDCGGTGNCLDCGGDGGLDDVQQCIWCEGSGRCLGGCHEGRKTQVI